MRHWWDDIVVVETMRGVGSRLAALVPHVLTMLAADPSVRWDDSEFVATAVGYIRNSACRSIFPVPVFGSSSMKSTSRGYLYGNSFALT